MDDTGNTGTLKECLDDTIDRMGKVVSGKKPGLMPEEVGIVTFVGRGIARLSGLDTIRSEELVRFPGDLYGLVFNVDADEVGIIMLDPSEEIGAGGMAHRTGRVLDVPVGEGMLGRVVDALGRPLDNGGEVRTAVRFPVEREAPPIMHRDPVTVPLQTGIKAIDALIPIGRGQRELILGDRQIGKTTIALDTIINQHDKDVVCIYCAIGKQSSDVAKSIAVLKEHNAMDYSVVVVASGEEPPGLQFVAPYAATAMGEYFMERGRDVLVIYDDLTRHARAYRELSLLLRRPPGREAFPGDIFYIHSRMLERSTHLRAEHGGGSLTALPIIETEAQDMSSYIPTNLISITDGQIYLSPNLFQKGILPPVDVGKSVSRVGGKAQLPAFRAVAGDLRIAYAQFEELESFSRFGTRLDDDTRRRLERGWRVREILKQPQYRPIPVAEQIAALTAVTGGILDDVTVENIGKAEGVVRTEVTKRLEAVCSRIYEGGKLSMDDFNAVLNAAREAVAGMTGKGDANP